MDAFAAGQLTRALDRLHSAIYFAPEANERFGKLGLEPRMQYFASRSAPMGAVTAKVVAATFYNFNLELIAQAIPAAWDLASPDTVMRVRYEIVDAVLPKILGEDRARSPELAHAVALVRRTAEAIPNVDGRPLYAGHAELDWPDTPYAPAVARDHLVAGVSGRRPYRRFGRPWAQRHRGADHPFATGIGFDPEYGRRLRGWSRRAVGLTAIDALKARDLLDDAGQLTAAGNDLRSKIEDLTDDKTHIHDLRSSQAVFPATQKRATTCEPARHHAADHTARPLVGRQAFHPGPAFRQHRAGLGHRQRRLVLGRDLAAVASGCGRRIEHRASEHVRAGGAVQARAAGQVCQQRRHIHTGNANADDSGCCQTRHGGGPH